MRFVSLDCLYLIVVLAGDGLKDVHGKLTIDDRHVLTEAIQYNASIGGGEVREWCAIQDQLLSISNFTSWQYLLDNGIKQLFMQASGGGRYYEHEHPP